MSSTFETAVERFSNLRQDAGLAEVEIDPRISTIRHRQAVRRAETRGRRLVLVAVLGTLGAVVLVPTAVRGALALAPQRFACDADTPKVLYSGPNAFSVATRINGDDWKNVPLRQTPEGEPVAAVNMAHTFTGEIYGPKNCQ